MKLTSVLLCCIILSVICCSDNPSGPGKLDPPRELTQLEKRLVASDNVFGLNLFREMASAETGNNLFLSPLSIAMALGMTVNGAAGTTEEAMRATLGFENMTNEEINASFQSLIELLTSLDPDVTFDIANSIWYRLGFTVQQDFLVVNQTYFDAEVQGLNFSLPSAPATINAWVAQKTQGKIEEIVEPPIDPLTVMFLINAIYFKGTWTVEFDPDLTSDAPFTTPEGAPTTCRMMLQEEDLPYLENDDFQAVNLSYGNGRFHMAVFLPKPGETVDELIAMFDDEHWAQWCSSFVTREVKLYMPKFKLEYKKKLNDDLKSLGMGIAFQPGDADFSGINPDEALFISKVMHKTYVDVDEEGTEAAAVTSVEVSLTSMPSVVMMKVDRPFAVVIWESHSNTILFIGRITAPATGN